MNPPLVRAPNLVDYALLLALGVIWGGSFFLIKIGVQSVPPMTLTAVRVVIAGIFMLGLAWAMGERLPRGWAIWGLVFLSGFFGNALPYFLITWGEEKIDSGLAAIIMALMPLATLLLAHLVIREDRMTPGKVAGVLMGLVGVVVLIGPTKLADLGEGTVRQLAVAGAALSYSVNAIVTRFMVGHARNGLVAAVMVASIAIILPAAFLHDDVAAIRPTWTASAAIGTLAVVQTALGTVLMLVIVSRQGATFFSQINFVVPLTGVLWGLAVLGEVPSPNALAALGLILAGIAVARTRSQGRSGGADETKRRMRT